MTKIVPFSSVYTPVMAPLPREESKQAGTAAFEQMQSSDIGEERLFAHALIQHGRTTLPHDLRLSLSQEERGLLGLDLFDLISLVDQGDFKLLREKLLQLPKGLYEALQKELGLPIETFLNLESVDERMHLGYKFMRAALTLGFFLQNGRPPRDVASELQDILDFPEDVETPTDDFETPLR